MAKSSFLFHHFFENYSIFYYCTSVELHRQSYHHFLSIIKKKLFFLLVHSYCYTSSNLSLPPYLPTTLHVTVTILLSLFLIFRLFFSLSYFELIQRHFSYLIHIFPHRMLVLSLSLFGFQVFLMTLIQVFIYVFWCRIFFLISHC